MSSWQFRSLGEVTEIAAGEPAPQRPEDFSEDGIPFVRMQDVGRYGQTTCLTETKDRLSVDASKRFKRYPAGAILVPKSGASIRLNHRAILGVEAHVVSHLAIIIPKQFVSARFLYYWLCTIDLSSIAHKADMPSLKTSELAKLQIPVPPLAEQERIVKLLDEADALRKLRTEADRRTPDLIAALFNESFGKGDTKAEERARLESVANVVSGVAKGRKFNGREFIEAPYLRVANVQAGHIDLSEIKTIQALPEEVEQLSLRRGDVLLTEGGDFDKLGRGAMLDRDLPGVIHQNHVFRVRVNKSKLEPIVLAEFLLTAEARKYFLNCAKRTTNLASINMTQLRALPVPVPPIDRQRLFAKRVNEIRAMQAEQAVSRQCLDDLFQSMLHRAFAGEL